MYVFRMSDTVIAVYGQKLNFYSASCSMQQPSVSVCSSCLPVPQTPRIIVCERKERPRLVTPTQAVHVTGQLKVAYVCAYVAKTELYQASSDMVGNWR